MRLQDIQRLRCRLQEAGADIFVGRQKRLQLGAQRIVGRAGFIEEPGPLLGAKLHGPVQQLLDTLPTFGRHGVVVRLIWRCNQTRAVAQSRSTVAREMPSAWDISGADNPPKNFISTIFACRTSMRDSSSSASSKARSSASPLAGRAARSSMATLHPPSRLDARRARA